MSDTTPMPEVTERDLQWADAILDEWAETGKIRNHIAQSLATAREEGRREGFREGQERIREKAALECDAVAEYNLRIQHRSAIDSFHEKHHREVRLIVASIAEKIRALPLEPAGQEELES